VREMREEVEVEEGCVLLAVGCGVYYKQLYSCRYCFPVSCVRCVGPSAWICVNSHATVLLRVGDGTVM
jgi:hypothetical protein